MTDIQLYILVAIPLVGILSNTALFIHISGRVDRLSDRIDTSIASLREDLKAVGAAINSLKADAAVLKDRAQL